MENGDSRLAKLFAQLMCNVVMALNGEQAEGRLGVPGVLQSGGLKGRKGKLPQINSENILDPNKPKDALREDGVSKTLPTSIQLSPSAVLDNVLNLKGFIHQYYFGEGSSGIDDPELSECLARMDSLTLQAEEWRATQPKESPEASEALKPPAAFKLMNRGEKTTKLNLIKRK